MCVRQETCSSSSPWSFSSAGYFEALQPSSVASSEAWTHFPPRRCTPVCIVWAPRQMRHLSSFQVDAGQHLEGMDASRLNESRNNPVSQLPLTHSWIPSPPGRMGTLLLPILSNPRVLGESVRFCNNPLVICELSDVNSSDGMVCGLINCQKPLI